MPSSPMHNVGDLGFLGLLWGCSQRIELSVPLEESLTLMGEFTSTLSSISADSSAVERLMFSMWEAATLTYRSLEGLQRRATTTGSRMAMWSQEDSNGRYLDRAEVALARLVLSGLQLRWQRTQENFGDFVTSWLQNMSAALSTASGATQTGSSGLWMNPTLPPMEYGLTRQRLRESTSGSVRLVWDLDHWD
ncbi:putative protein [Gemycircularvirus gemy-ch-rat1]|uniref:Uncharacterized protein n=1 Tax=Gemycircularvirus gemy-ch-rat1 TaxID=1708653 RepID=A0A0M5IIA1_9VIRU|nr:putative protein [Gemycircularvirus gemy-ch-rat1]ALC04312.1 putative protein [Gemycircularvirus gemy-ch-rat1]